MNKSYLQYIKESKDYIGRKVMMKDTSEYRNQAYRNGGDGFGKIINYNKSLDNEENLPYTIVWNNGIINVYQIGKDFELVDNENDDDTVSIKWYKKGKFEKE